MCLSPLNNCGPLQDYRAINLQSYHPTLVQTHLLPSATSEQVHSHPQETHKIQLNFAPKVRLHLVLPLDMPGAECPHLYTGKWSGACYPHH